MIINLLIVFLSLSKSIVAMEETAYDLFEEGSPTHIGQASRNHISSYIPEATSFPTTFSTVSKKSDDDDDNATEVDSIHLSPRIKQNSPNRLQHLKSKGYKYIANNIGYLNGLTGLYLTAELTLDNYYPDIDDTWLPLTKTILKLGLCTLNICAGTVLLYAKCKRVCFNKNQQYDDL